MPSVMSGAASLAIGLLPVVLFLVALLLLDSYKLVGRTAVLASIGAGAVAAVVCFLANTALLYRVGLDANVLGRAVAPVLEETAKAAFLFVLIRSGRVG